ncbi:hypothetical protein P7K49_011772 [Saguinus oedipus]|uniref:Uncharacterized protein n=1 Tax=Saguinus oedipus TaxID=9490 RepID=A0ABQ9VRL6_SAGOE|nr:hypothetical protein P7K49_011772 [Saguinus oedipus]
MEDFSAEEEEPWYDQQDLEQGGEHPVTPVRFSIVGRYHPGRGWAGPGAPGLEERRVWRTRTWKEGALPEKTRTGRVETCKRKLSHDKASSTRPCQDL